MHAELELLGSKTHGIFTVEKARKHLSENQINYAVKTRRLISIHRGVYRVAGSPLTVVGSIYAATLATGGLASHISALMLHGLLRERVHRPHLTI